ncbi:hypothetical protein QQP08_001257 [Theobroma cacao]|nr:hypothetical protein QQP08_001257 [Theobroma cacao]
MSSGEEIESKHETEETTRKSKGTPRKSGRKDKIQTVAMHRNEWVENADRWVAGFLEMFEEGCHKMVSKSNNLCMYFRILAEESTMAFAALRNMWSLLTFDLIRRGICPMRFYCLAALCLASLMTLVWGWVNPGLITTPAKDSVSFGA